MILKSLLSLVAPMAFLRLYMGGGGDGGAGDIRAAEEERQRKVQSAVDAINGKFGIGGTGVNVGPEPSRDSFIIPIREGKVYYGENGPIGQDAPTSGGFDQAGYDAAMAAYQGRQAQAGGDTAEVAGARTARNAMYSDISGAVRDAATRDLDRQYTTASNRNKFGLARSGLLGGTVDAESGGQLRELYGEGKIKAAQAGVQAAADLRGQDEKTRQNLTSLAQSGLDTGTAASMAAGQMSAAADSARGAAAGSTVGRLFDDLSQAYVLNQVGKARTQGQQPTGGYSTPSLYGAKPYYGRAG